MDTLRLLKSHVQYPNYYAWLILLSALDIMLTDTILRHFVDFGGRELNSLANVVIERAGLWGAIGLKVASIGIAIGIVEYIGRRRPHTGKALAGLMVGLAILPVAWELASLGWFAFSTWE